MAFDLLRFLGPDAANRLLQPNLMGPASNMLVNPQAAPPLPPPVDVPTRTVMPANEPPMQQQAAPQSAQMVPQAAPSKSPFGGIDKQALNDIFLGWAMGQTPMQSLAMGAAQASKGKSQRGNINQTVEWLKGRGMDEGQARMVAGNPQTLQQYLTQMLTPEDPMKALQKQKLELEIQGMQNPQAKATDDIREYQFARDQGYNGTFQQYMSDMKKAGAINVDARQMGNIPPGYQVEYDTQGRPARMLPIPGSPAANELDAAQQQRQARTDTKETAGNVVVQDINRIFDTMGKATLPTTGYAGDFLSGIPGTAARDIRGLVDTVKANATFDKLQQMREASPTGGALGAVSDTENRLLAAAIGNLEQSQTEQQFKDNLARVQNIYLDIIHGKGKGPERRSLSFENGSSGDDPLGIR